MSGLPTRRSMTRYDNAHLYTPEPHKSDEDARPPSYSAAAMDSVSTRLFGVREEAPPPPPRPAQHAAKSKAHTVSLEGISRLLFELSGEREWLASENEKLFHNRILVCNELRETEKALAELGQRKTDLEARLQKIGAREHSIKAMLDEIDAKMLSIGEESAGFERKVRQIKGSAALSAELGRESVLDTCTRTMYGHSGAVTAVHYDPARGVVISGSADRTARLWSAESGVCVQSFIGHSGWVHAAQADETVAVTGSGDRTLRLWDVASGAARMTLSGHTGSVSALQFKGSTLLSGSVDATARLWDLETGEALQTMAGHSGYVSALQFWEYGLATASGDSSVRMWDIRTGRCHRTLCGHGAGVTSVQFDENELVSASSDRTVRIWDLRKGACRATIVMDDPAAAVAFSPAHIVCASESVVAVYGRETRDLLSTLTGHQGTVKALCLQDDLLVTASADATVKTWLL